MAMTQGSVSVAANGAVTKSGITATLYDTLVARTNTKLAAFGQPALTDSADGQAGAKQGMADMANDIASWLFTVLTTQAQAKVPNSAAGDGLQTTPNPNNPATACTRPAADKFLSIV